MSGDESTPLLRERPSAHKRRSDHGDNKKQGLLSWLRNAGHVENRILFAGFLITLSFSFTQVP